MATLTDLETRFKNRLGITTLSTVGQSQVREAINASAARLASDGLPGLSVNYFSGESIGATALTVSSHSAGDSTVTFTSVPTTPVVAGDVVKFSDNVFRLIYSINGSTYDFGSPITVQQTGAATLYQRSVKLPSAGRVLEAINLDEYTKLTPDPDAILRYGLEPYTGVTRYTQTFDGTNAYLLLWPVHDSATRIGCKQFKSLSTLGALDDLGWPDETLDAVLTKALDIWRSWRTGGISPIEADLSKRAVRDTSDAKNVSSPRKPQVRGRV